MHATGGTSPFGIEGWRFAFLSVALVSIAIGIGNFMFAHDPRFPPGQDKVLFQNIYTKTVFTRYPRADEG